MTVPSHYWLARSGPLDSPVPILCVEVHNERGFRHQWAGIPSPLLRAISFLIDDILEASVQRTDIQDPTDRHCRVIACVSSGSRHMVLLHTNVVQATIYSLTSLSKEGNKKLLARHGLDVLLDPWRWRCSWNPWVHHLLEHLILQGHYNDQAGY